FGVRALLARKNYSSTATASEESLVYAIPIATFEPILTETPEVALYFAAGFAAGAPVRNSSMRDTNKARVGLNTMVSPSMSLHLDDVLRIDTSKNLLACPAATSIRLAAQMMSDKNTSFIMVIDGQDRPLGIITDTDMRRQVVAGHVAIDDQV